MLRLIKFALCTSIFLSFNAQGFSQNWLWAKSGYGMGTGEGFSVSADTGGNVFATGYFASPTIAFGSTILTNTNGTIPEMFIVKYDPSGNVLWAKSAGGAGNDMGYSISTDIAGNVFVTGMFQSSTITFGSFILYNTGGWDVFIVKYDTNGNELWAKNAGGTNDDFGYSVSTDSGGNMFVTGMFQSPSITFGSTTLNNTNTGGFGDIFLAKYDTNGNLLWANSIGGIKDDGGNSVSTDAVGNVFVTGYFNSPTITFGSTTLTNTGSMNIFLAKYDASGNVLWAKSAGGTYEDVGNSVCADIGGNVFITGNFKSPTITFGSTTLNNSTGTGSDVFIAKYDANGNAVWARGAGGNLDDFGYSVSADANGNVFATGGWLAHPTITFGSITLAPSLTNCSGQCDPMFLVKYDPNGNVLCASALSSGGDDPNGVSVDHLGNAFIVSDYIANPLIIGSDTLTLPLNAENIFVAKYTCRSIITANISSTSTCTGACNGTAMATVISGMSPYTYSWNTTPIQTTPTANGLCAGNYQVIIKDAALTADTLMVTVNVTSPTTALITGITSICKGQNTTLTAAGGGTYLWNTNAVSNAITVSPISDSIYSVIVSNTGCSDTAQVTINVNIPPIAAISGSSIICGGQSTTLTVSGSGTYSWNTGATSAILTIAPMTTTPYTVIVTNSSGCSDTASQIVTVNSSPTAVISGNNTICIGQSTTLIASGGLLFNWNIGANTAAISVAPITTTTYTITVIDGSGCTDTASQTITVNTYPTASISGNVTICEGDNTTLTASGGETYLWNSGETNSTITISPLNNTTDSVIVSNGHCSDTTFINIIVNNRPTAYAGTNIIIFPGDSMQLNATGGGTYDWSPSIGLSCTNCANPIASPSTTTNYCVTVTYSNGCADSACLRVTVENPCLTNDNFKVPNAFSPNNDGHNDMLLLQGWKNCVTEFTVIIYDRWGEKVFESEEPDKGWDGTYKGKLMDPAVFAYYINATIIGGKKIIRKGNISLIR